LIDFFPNFKEKWVILVLLLKNNNKVRQCKKKICNFAKRDYYVRKEIMTNYQDRIFLQLLDNKQSTELIKKILKSPLGLSTNIIIKLFNNELSSLKDDLDKIKMFAAGISRAEKLTTYKLAQYYPHMFAFHQFFQSSYRARQGKVLEEMIKNILENYANCNEVPDKVVRMQEILSKSFNSTIQNLDIDVMGLNSDDNKIVLLQLRSRDDTGGTTAKGSLVDLLRMLLRLENEPDKSLLYLICVWDARNSQQKNSTISKMYSSLKEYVADEDKFRNDIAKGYKINNQITLKLAYGTEEISNALFEWTETDDKNILHSIKDVVNLIQNWDDLWIAYSVANIELEINNLKSFSNIELLNQKTDFVGFDIDFTNYETICISVESLVNKILPIWNEDSIPLTSISDKAHYIRDLIFLKVIFSKL
jgi:hypothetical protein